MRRHGCSSATRAFDTAYVGSSNLTHSALLDGLEWNVRATAGRQPGDRRADPSDVEQYWNRARIRGRTTRAAWRTTAGCARCRERLPARGTPPYRLSTSTSSRSRFRSRYSRRSAPSASEVTTGISSSPRPAPARRGCRRSTIDGLRAAGLERSCSSPIETRFSSRAKRSFGWCWTTSRSASATSAGSGHRLEPCLRVYPIDPQAHRAVGGHAVRCRHHRRVSSRGSGHLREAPGAPIAYGAHWAYGYS